MFAQTLSTYAYPQSGVVKSQLQQCIELCLECNVVCLETLAYSQARTGRYLESVHLRLLRDCAEMCHTNANFMQRFSDFYGGLSKICARVCRDCAHDCERYAVSAIGSGAPLSNYSGSVLDDPTLCDPRLKACAEVCRSCASACRELAASKGL